jgi:hypothetical protein
VHGVVDVVHSQELFRALDAELRLRPEPLPPTPTLLEGAARLRALIEGIIQPPSRTPLDLRPSPRWEERAYSSTV